MRYPDVEGIGRVSRIGLGTWQFGSREWGYGDRYASGAARDIVQRALALGVTLLHRRNLLSLREIPAGQRMHEELLRVVGQVGVDRYRRC